MHKNTTKRSTTALLASTIAHVSGFAHVSKVSTWHKEYRDFGTEPQ